MPKYAKRSDGNHTEIINAFRALGFSVADLRGACDTEPGCPDLLVATFGGNSALVEVKKGNGKLRDSQIRFSCNWLGRIETVRSVEDVEAVEKKLRSNEK